MKSDEEVQPALIGLKEADPETAVQTSRADRTGWADAAVALSCAIGAAVAFITAGDIAAFVLTARPPTKLADPPRVSKLMVLAIMLLAIGVSLGAAAWRTRQPNAVHRAVASQWSAGFTVVWALLSLYMVLLYYPLPYHSHHIDKLLLGSGVILLWSLGFILKPAGLTALLKSPLYGWMKISLINVLVFICVGEVAFRLMDPVLARHGLFGNKHSPADLRPHVETKGSIRWTNSQGFRDRERQFARTAGVPRIVALGDSFTYGAGVSYDEIFTTLVERSLQSLAPGLELINLGVSGWDPSEEFHLFKIYGSRFQPDLVMMNFFVGNDIMRRRGAYLEEPIVVAGRSYYVHTIGNWFHDTFGPDRWYLYHNLNYLFTVGANRFKLREDTNKGPATDIGSWRPFRTKSDYLKDIDERSEIYVKRHSPLFEYHWNRTLMTLNEMRQFVRSRGMSLMLVLLPAQEQLDHHLQQELAAALGTGLGQYDFEKPQRMLKAWGDQHDVTVVDLLPAFRGERDPTVLYFENDIHWTVSGHAVAAAHILPSMRNWITSGNQTHKTPE